ncbi:MAG: ribulokinase [Alphaproteobacteria bacterium]|nr:ribulokinase [Alphaproteobacteria bacterium]
MSGDVAVLGLDFGTSGVRGLLVDAVDGAVRARAAAPYRSGAGGVLLVPNSPLLARQHPGDYIAALTSVVRTCMSEAAANGVVPDIAGIGVCATASTPIPVDGELRPLACQAAFADNLHAAAWLWKDHTAQHEADEITAAFRSAAPARIAWYGGIYSAEWYWAKILRCARIAPEVFAAAADWVELSDYVPAWLCGVFAPSQLQRNRAVAGHKAMYRADAGGWPMSILRSLEPTLPTPAGDVRDGGAQIGTLCPSAAAALGLPPDIPIATGGIDAHVSAVGAGVRPGTLVKIMGTSCCDITMGPPHVSLSPISGVSGVAPGSVAPDHDGVEAGQAAVGDLYAWAAEEHEHEALTAEAAALAPGQSGLVMLDWINGSRSPINDARLSGLVIGHTLATTRAHHYRAAIEATAFGAELILQQIEAGGVAIERIVMCGGIAERNRLVARLFADILERPIEISGVRDAGALGAAMFAAVAGGVASSIAQAQQRFAQPPIEVALPRKSEAYRQLRTLYRALHDAFGRPSGALAQIMPALAHLRETTASGANS